MKEDIRKKVVGFFGAYPLRSFAQRQIMIRADETPNSVFYIVEGRVSQYDVTATGNEVVVNVFKPGSFFPMSSAINGTPNPYLFEASDAVKVRQAPAADAVAFLRANPDVMFDLLARVYKGTDGVLRRMAHLMGGDAQSRLTFELLNAAARFGQSHADGSTQITLTERDLAKHSGLARETVNRCMQNLKAAGLLDITRDGIIIKDLSQLDATLGSSL
jgi:CRP/FNR family transcriptional regulator, cyclic AMP receptor protein